jgi:outer membrane protein W
MVAYSFTPDARLRPWVGVGAGYHVDGRSVGTSLLTNVAKGSGVDFVVAQAGLDAGIKRWNVGPFAALLMGIDQSSSVTVAGSKLSDGTDTYLRGYLLLGLRGTLDL